jgi:hypothetical protein
VPLSHRTLHFKRTTSTSSMGSQAASAKMASIKLTHFDREVYEPAEVRGHVVFDTAAAVAGIKPSVLGTDYSAKV